MIKSKRSWTSYETISIILQIVSLISLVGIFLQFREYHEATRKSVVHIQLQNAGNAYVLYYFVPENEPKMVRWVQVEIMGGGLGVYDCQGDVDILINQTYLIIVRSFNLYPGSDVYVYMWHNPQVKPMINRILVDGEYIARA